MKTELSQVTNQFSLSLHTSLVILFFFCSLSICWRWFSESLSLSWSTLLETQGQAPLTIKYQNISKKWTHRNKEIHLTTGEQKIIVIASCLPINSILHKCAKTNIEYNQTSLHLTLFHSNPVVWVLFDCSSLWVTLRVQSFLINETKVSPKEKFVLR